MTDTTETGPDAGDGAAAARAGRKSGLDAMLLPELKRIAGGLGIRTTGLRKGALVEAIKEHQAPTAVPARAVAAPQNAGSPAGSAGGGGRGAGDTAREHASDSSDPSGPSGSAAEQAGGDQTPTNRRSRRASVPDRRPQEADPSTTGENASAGDPTGTAGGGSAEDRGREGTSDRTSREQAAGQGQGQGSDDEGKTSKRGRRGQQDRPGAQDQPDDGQARGSDRGNQNGQDRPNGQDGQDGQNGQDRNRQDGNGQQRGDDRQGRSDRQSGNDRQAGRDGQGGSDRQGGNDRQGGDDRRAGNDRQGGDDRQGGRVGQDGDDRSGGNARANDGERQGGADGSRNGARGNDRQGGNDGAGTDDGRPQGRNGNADDRSGNDRDGGGNDRGGHDRQDDDEDGGSRRNRRRRGRDRDRQSLSGNQGGQGNQGNDGGGQGNQGNQGGQGNQGNQGNQGGPGNQGGRGTQAQDRSGQGTSGRGGRHEPDMQILEDDVLAPCAGILDLMDNYAFVRTSGYLPGADDVYVSMSLVRKFGLRRGDAVVGQVRQPREGERKEKFNPLVRIDSVNGAEPDSARSRVEFAALTPLYPTERLRMETTPANLIGRVIDVTAPIGKGQRGLVVSPSQAGKTKILQSIATSVTANNPECHLMVVLVDERPEDVTEFQRVVKGEVVSSTFDRSPGDHTIVAELAIERAKRLVELGHDVVVLLDGLTRLARAYNLTGSGGRTLPGGVDSSALHPPKRFFGAARNVEDGGSLTILATALVGSGSRTDEVILEEFTSTATMELHLRREYADQRVFPAVDPVRTGTRREELLMGQEELAIVWKLRRALSKVAGQEALETLLTRLRASQTNLEFLTQVQKDPVAPEAQAR